MEFQIVKQRLTVNKTTGSRIIKIMLSITLITASLLCIFNSPAQATLQRPLRGADLKSQLTPEQHARAMYFMAIKASVLDSNTADAMKSLERITLVRNVIHSIIDMYSFAGAVDDTTNNTLFMGEKNVRIAQAANVIANGVSGPKLKFYLLNRMTADETAFVFMFTGTTLKMLNQSVPFLMEDTIYQQYIQALESDNIDNIATKLSQLLQHPNPIIQLIIDTAVESAIDIVSKLPEYASKANNLKMLVKDVGLWKGVKAVALARRAVPVAQIVTGVLGIVTDIAAIWQTEENISQQNTTMIALEFLDYYLVTYKGNLQEFSSAINANGSSISELYDAFLKQKNELGQTMKELYGAVSWLDYFSNPDKASAVEFIGRVLRENGPLAFNIGYQGGTGLSYIGVGDTTTYKYTPDPMLELDYNFIAARVYQHLPNGNTLEGQDINGTSTITPLTTLPGKNSFEISYGFNKKSTGGAYAYTYTISDEYLIPSDAISLPPSSISSKIVNDGGGYYLSLTFSKPAGAITYSRNTSTTNTAVSGAIVQDGDTCFYARIIDKSGFYGAFNGWWKMSNENSTVVLPITYTAALLAKSGIIGDYRVEMEMIHPSISGIAKNTNDLQITYNDLTATFNIPYLQLSVPDASTANFNSQNGSFTANPGDIIKLKVNNDPTSFIVNQTGKTIKVVALVPNGSAFGNFVAGTLNGDEVSFVINTTLDGLTMTAGTYRVLGIVSIDSNGLQKWADFSMVQMLGYDQTSSGTGTTPPSTTGSIMLPRTGQYRCYDSAGAEIPCAGTGQDGDIQAGKRWTQTPRFTDNGDQTITDTVTGLIWPKDAGTPTVGACMGGAMTWQGALDYVDCLNNNNYLNHTDWRLPNVIELKSLIDRQRSYPALPAGYPFTNLFTNFRSKTFWSSSTSAYGTHTAWGCNMDYDAGFQNKDYNGNYALPVRGGQGGDIQLPRTGQTACYNANGAEIDCATQGQTQDAAMVKGVAWDPVSRFTTNNGTVTDNLTGLIWLQNANCFGAKTWADALSSANTLASGACGLSDGSSGGAWRLPSVAELESLIDRSSYPVLPTGHPFTNAQSYNYWSSSTVAYNKGFAWRVDIFDGHVNSGFGKSHYDYVWPVRGGELDPVKIYPPTATFISENLPDGSYQVGSATKSWRFKSGASAITGLKAVKVSADDGLGISQSEINIGDVPANAEFLVNLPICPIHSSSSLWTSYWKLVDGTGSVTVTNSKTNQFWLKLLTNRPPEFSQLQLESIGGKVGQQVSLPILAADPDADSISYSVISGAGSTVSGTWMGKTAILYQNTFATPGVFPITIRISDNYGGSASKTIYAVITSDTSVKDFFADLKYANATTDQLKDQYRAINYLALQGIVIGLPDPNDPNGRIFKPTDVANQAEAMKMLMMAANVRGLVELDAEPRYLPNLEKLDRDTGEYYNFTWATPFILKAEALGMIDSADTFEPYKPATREWFAGMVAVLLRLNPPIDLLTNTTEYSFADAADFSSTDAYDKARAAAFFGFMWHLGDTSIFNPKDSMIRADVAVVVSKVLRQPTLDGITTTGLANQTINGKTLPSIPHGQTFSVTGITNLNGHRMLDDGSGNIKEDDIFNSAEYVKVTVVRPGIANPIVGEKMASALAAAPVTVPTNPPDISYTEERSLLVLVEATDIDGRNRVRNMYRLNYFIIFPDRDGDGIRDDLDLWPDNPFYVYDANDNGIPDNADALWGLANRHGRDTVRINRQSMSLIDAVLNGVLGSDKTAPTTTLAINGTVIPVVTTTMTLNSSGLPYSVTLKADETASIRYTTDGTPPNFSSNIYSAPILITATTLIQYYATDLVGNIETPKYVAITVDASLVNGVCGSAEGKNFFNLPQDNFCSTGMLSGLSGDGPWTWQCEGRNGGTTARCIANKVNDNGTGFIQLPKSGINYCTGPADSATPGSFISCYGTGQDGETQYGSVWPEPRFASDSQLLSDNLTGLVWTKDTNAPGPSVCGPGTSKSWAEALSYVQCLNDEHYLGFNDWRLPNYLELDTLVNYQNVVSGGLAAFGVTYADTFHFFWSSTTDPSQPVDAWYANLDGSMQPSMKIGKLGAWPVRGGQGGVISLPQTGQSMCWDATGNIQQSCNSTGQDGDTRAGVDWPSPRFTNNNDRTVTDILTGLIWSKETNTPGPAECSSGISKSWQGAFNHIRCLNSNNYLGHNDWRVPNTNELRSIINLQNASQLEWLITSGFQNIQSDYYHTSTGRKSSLYYSDGINFGSNYYFGDTGFIWPVRGGQAGGTHVLNISNITPSGSSLSGSVTPNIGIFHWESSVMKNQAYASNSYLVGTVVTLTPTPVNGYVFAGWMGDCTGRTACTVKMDTMKHVTAVFAQSADVAGACGNSMYEPTTIIPPSELCSFGNSVGIIKEQDRWVWGCGGLNNGQTVPCWTGDYTPPTIKLTITKEPGGDVTAQYHGGNLSINWSGNVGTANYQFGSPVTLTATPNYGYVYAFSGWDGACTNTYGTCTVTFLNGANVTAKFSADTVKPAISAFSLPATSNTLSVAITLNATDNMRIFRYCLSEINDSNVCGTDASVISYTYPLTQYTFTSYGNRTLYAFVSDYAGNIASASAKIDIIGPDQKTLFVTLAGGGNGTITSNPQGIGPIGISCTSGTCTTTFPFGKVVDLLNTPDAVSTFAGWSGDCSGSGNCSVTMGDLRYITATFNLAPKAMNINTGVPYSTISEAIFNANAGAEIQLLDTQFDGPFTLDKALILKGGRNTKFTGLSGHSTVLNGGLTVTSGDSSAETIDVIGKLIIQGGHLRVNGVKVR